VRGFKRFLLQVDQAFVSLVDKEVMRSKLAQVYEVVKTFLKSAEAAKLAAANTSAEEVAKIALEKQQVQIIMFSFYSPTLFQFGKYIVPL